MATEEMSEQDMKQEAFTLLAQGKRHFMVKDYFEATTSLALACEYLARIFGESADECGDAYFTYGKALLELARSETGVLGNAIEEKDEQDDDDSEEDNAEAAAGSTGDSVTEPEGADDKANTPDEVDKESDADTNEPAVTTSEKTESQEVDSSVKETDAVGTTDNKTETADKLVSSTSSKSENNEPGPSTAGPSKENGHTENGAEGSDDEDDVSNLHLAWEVLELAKNIFAQRAASGAQEHELRLAEVQLCLGEVAMESENYTDATADMALCLALQKKHLADDDRRVAETLYQMGVAYSLANSFDEAISSFSECGHVLERRVASLRRQIAAGDTPPSDDPFYTFMGEVEQLEKLFPEIREKIFDMQDFKQETLRALAGGGDPGAGSSKSTEPGPANDKPATSIGHLVRKKAKSDEPDAKRARVDEGEKE